MVPASRREDGFSIMEAIIGTLIAVIAIVGLAHSFGIGRGLINRYETARAALGAAQARMEWLASLPLDDSNLAVGATHATFDFEVQGAVAGTDTWRVEAYDDPSTAGTTYDMRQVTVMVAWTDGEVADTVQVSRLFLRP